MGRKVRRAALLAPAALVAAIALSCFEDPTGLRLPYLGHFALAPSFESEYAGSCPSTASGSG